jgi:hypothetical protein
MLLIFNNNLDLPETKYIEAGSDIKKRDYSLSLVVTSIGGSATNVVGSIGWNEVY